VAQLLDIQDVVAHFRVNIESLVENWAQRVEVLVDVLGELEGLVVVDIRFEEVLELLWVGFELLELHKELVYIEEFCLI